MPTFATPVYTQPFVVRLPRGICLFGTSFERLYSNIYVTTEYGLINGKSNRIYSEFVCQIRLAFTRLERVGYDEYLDIIELPVAAIFELLNRNMLDIDSLMQGFDDPDKNTFTAPGAFPFAGRKITIRIRPKSSYLVDETQIKFFGLGDEGEFALHPLT